MNTLSRFLRIRSEFGTWMLIKTLLLFLVATVLAVFCYLDSNSILPAFTVGAGLFVGWLLRREIVEHFEILNWALPITLFVYGVVMFLGERVLGLSLWTRMLIVTMVSIVTFSIQFWSLSDPSIVKEDCDW